MKGSAGVRSIRRVSARLLAFLVPMLALAGCAGGESGAADAGKQACQMVQVATLPFTASKHGYVASIALNGQEARMILDTGASRSLISGESRSRLKLRGDTFNSETISGVHGFAGVSIAYVSDVKIGALQGKRLALMAEPEWRPAEGIDGLLGIDYLAAFDLDIDVVSGQLGFYKALSGCHEPASAMTGSVYSVEMMNFGDSGDPAIYVAVTMNGQNFTAELDTGNFQTSIYRGAVDEAGLTGAESIAALKVRDITKERLPAKVVIAPTLEIGDLAIKNIPLVVLDAHRNGKAAILLGRDFFQRVHVWISQSSRSVIMQFPPAATPAVAN